MYYYMCQKSDYLVSMIIKHHKTYNNIMNDILEVAKLKINLTSILNGIRILLM